MTDRGMMFKPEMVLAILKGQKTQTRRLVKPQPISAEDGNRTFDGGVPLYANDWKWPISPGISVISNKKTAPDDYIKKHIGIAAGDRIWVREAFMPRCDVDPKTSPEKARHYAYYRASAPGAASDDGHWHEYPKRWTPAIHMPRWASRITLTVTEVRVQRLQEIDLRDAMAEGCEVRQMWLFGADTKEARDEIGRGVYRNLWESINGRESWAANPWVVAYTFTVEKQNIDAGRALLASPTP